MKYQYSKDSKAFKVQQALQSGEVLSASTASKRFGIKNIRAEVARVRANGFVVNTVNRKAKNGVIVTEYALGTASREMIALAYRAKAAGLSV